MSCVWESHRLNGPLFLPIANPILVHWTLPCRLPTLHLSRMSSPSLTVLLEGLSSKYWRPDETEPYPGLNRPEKWKEKIICFSYCVEAVQIATVTTNTTATSCCHKQAKGEWQKRPLLSPPPPPPPPPPPSSIFECCSFYFSALSHYSKRLCKMCTYSICFWLCCCKRDLNSK